MMALSLRRIKKFFMKKEDLQNSQQETGSTENTGNSRNQQKNEMTNISNTQQNKFARQAGLGRDRMTDTEDSGGLSGRDDYADTDKNDLTNQDLNASNDQ
jgi:hypothetical protein